MDLIYNQVLLLRTNYMFYTLIQKVYLL